MQIGVDKRHEKVYIIHIKRMQERKMEIMKNKISEQTQRNLYQVIGILGLIAELEVSGDKEALGKVIENCANAAEGAKALLESAAFEITEFCELEG